MLRPNFVPVFMGLELYKVNFFFRAPRLSTLSAKGRWAASYQGFDTVYTGVIEGLGSELDTEIVIYCLCKKTLKTLNMYLFFWFHRNEKKRQTVANLLKSTKNSSSEGRDETFLQQFVCK